MNQFGHILRKDVRRLRWWLTAWLVLLALRTVLGIVGPRVLAEGGFAERFLLGQLAAAVGLLAVILFAVVLARLVHDEPLVGLDWFWLTRPYDRNALAAAKLTLAAIVLIAATTIADLVVMGSFGVGLTDMLRASTVLLERDARWTLGLMLVAVLTPSLTAFAMGVTGVLAAVLAAGLAVVSAALLTSDLESPPAITEGDPVPGLIASLVWIGASLALVVSMYRTRRRARTLALAVATAVLLLVVLPGLALLRPAGRTGAAQPPEHLAHVVPMIPRDEPPLIIDSWRSGARGRWLQVPVHLPDLPAGLGVQQIYARSRLELPDGHVLESAQSGTTRIHGGAEPRPHPIGAALGVRLLGAPEHHGVQSAAVLTVSDDELGRHGRSAGRLVTELHFLLERSHLVGTLQPVEGAVLELANGRIEILSVRRHPRGTTVLARQWWVRSLLSAHGPYRQHRLVLRNRARGEAMLGSSEQFMVTGQGGGASASFPLLLAFHGSAGFEIQNMVDSFPAGDAASQAPLALEEGWLDAADLAVVETYASDVLVRTVMLEDFRMLPGDGR